MIVRPKHPMAIAIGGNRTAFAVYPEDDLSVIILTNLMGGLPDTFIDEVAGYYIPEMKIENGFELSDDLNTLRLALDQNGYENAIETAQELNITFIEAEINVWGYKLINALKKQQAMQIFTLNTKLFPESANTYDSLADSYDRLGDTDVALKYYQKVLELEPDNGNAQFQLNRLRNK
ncbi:MAG: tetratricopeptide repeat protein [Kordiimonadaceae bacterium]|nr:tetratricopeptide repeat protein [Kordiimonadaceae bacterium]